MRINRIGIIAVSASLFGVACGDSLGPASSVLEGQVSRGPVIPVCTDERACYVPFAADFEVWRGGRRVARFRTGSDGHFSVPLVAGRYQLVPGSDAPLLSPENQVKTVDVGVGRTEVALTFDTGIR
jgi:hypothetical protein